MKVGYPNLPPGIAKLYIGSLSRGSAGAQTITGLGFAPKAVIFLANDADIATEAFSQGFDKLDQRACIFKGGNVATVYQSIVRSIVIQVDVANFIRGYITSMDADGFTVTWDLTGSATAYVVFLAMR